MANLQSVAAQIWFRSRDRVDSATIPPVVATIVSASARTFSVALPKEVIAVLPVGRVPHMDFVIVDVLGVQNTIGPLKLTIVDGELTTWPSDSIPIHRGSDATLSGTLTDTAVTISGVQGTVVLPRLAVGIRGEAGEPGLVFRGAYTVHTTYSPKDVVTIAGSAWVATVQSVDVVPGTDPAKWTILASKGDPGDAIDRTPFTIFASGQSNMAQKPAYSWLAAPPTNLHFFNWDGTEAGIGTAFAPVSATIVSISRWFGALVAWLNPDRDVYVIDISWGGMPIHHWIGGLNYIYDGASTAIANPGVGKIRFNSLTPSAITEMAMSVTDAAAAIRFGSVFPTATRFRIAKADDPSVYIEVDPSSTWTWNSSWFDVLVAYTSNAGSLSDGDALKITIEPNLQQIIRNNLPPALAAIGVSKVDLWLWWQGESDPFALSAYPADFEILNDWLISDGFLDYDTPTIVWGTSNYVVGDINGIWVKLNKPLQRVVHGRPDTRTFVYTSVLPTNFWEKPISIGLHLTAEGVVRAARLGYDAWSGGTGRKTLFGAVYDPFTGALEINAGSGAAPGFQFQNVNGGFWSPRVDNVTFGIAAAEGITLGVNGLGIGLGANPTNIFETKRTGAGASTNVAAWKNSGEYITQHVQTQCSDDTIPPESITFKGRGTLAAPAAVHQNDFGLIRDVELRGATNWVFAFRETVKVTEPTPSDTAMGLRWSLAFAAVGTIGGAEAIGVDHETGLSLRGAQVIDQNRHFRLRPYTVAALLASNPSPSPAGQMVVVLDRSYRQATSDGSNWRFADGTIIS